MAGRKEFTALHKFGLEIIGPLQAGVSKFSGFAVSLKREYVDLINVKNENEQLRL
jgi:hypothetical protein